MQFRSRTLSHGSGATRARPIATTPFRTRTYSNASSNCGEVGGGGGHPSPPLTDFTLPAQSVLTPPSSSNTTMDSPAYREVVRQGLGGNFDIMLGLIRISHGNGADNSSLSAQVAMSPLPFVTAGASFKLQIRSNSALATILNLPI